LRVATFYELTGILAENIMDRRRYYWLLLAEGHLNRRRFGAMLGRIALLPIPAG